MLYRPKFCCHCGEKVARAKWMPWTSRRFCEFCEVEQMQHELLPKAGMAIALLIGAAGAVSYFGSNRPTGLPESKKEAVTEVHRLKEPDKPKTNVAEPSRPAAADVSDATKLQRAAPPEPSTEAVYYCGALTRKGTPCTRRLKTKGRCWQHIGQPSAEDPPKGTSRP